MRSLESGGRQSHVAPEHWKRGRRAWSRAVREAHTSVQSLVRKQSDTVIRLRWMAFEMTS